MALNLKSRCKCKTLFHGTARGPNLSKQLLELGNHVDTNSHKPTSPSEHRLYMISDRDHRAITEMLVNAADVDGVDLAIKLNTNREALKRFLKTENIAHVFDGIVLNYAIFRCMDVDLIQELLIHEADIYKTNSSDPTSLHIAADVNSNLIVFKQLLMHGADPNAEADFLYRGMNLRHLTPLHWALMCRNDANVIEELLKFGADVNRPLLPMKATPLFIALCRNKDLQIIGHLIKAGADLNVSIEVGETGHTLLGVAAVCCHNLEVIKKLFQYRTDWSDSKINNDLLSKAIDFENIEFAKILIKCTLLTFEGDYYKIFDLSPYEATMSYFILSYWLEDCIDGIVQMKTMKVRNDLSLFMFVTTKNTSIPLYSLLEYTNNECTKSITVKENLIFDYPMYGDMISPKVEYALERAVLLNKLRHVRVYNNWCCLTNELEGRKELTCDTMYVLAKYLSNEDLYNLILVFNKTY